MQKLILSLFALSLSAWAAAQDFKWSPLTTAKRPECNAEQPCRIAEKNGNFEVSFETQNAEKLKTVREIRIRNMKDNSLQTYKVEEMNSIPDAEFFELYLVRFRPGGNADLALHAYNSAHEGKVFYYFLYDQNKQKFIMSEGTFPKLNYQAKSKKFVSDLQGHPYVLNKDLKLVPTQAH